MTRRNKAEPVVRRGFASTSSLRFVPFFRSVKNHNLSNCNFSGKVRGKVCACFVRETVGGDGNRKDWHASRDSSGSRCTPIRPLPLSSPIFIACDRRKKRADDSEFYPRVQSSFSFSLSLSTKFERSNLLRRGKFPRKY